MTISKVSSVSGIPTCTPCLSKYTRVMSKTNTTAVVTPERRSPQKRKHVEISRNIIRKEIKVEPNLKKERKSPKCQPSKPFGVETPLDEQLHVQTHDICQSMREREDQSDVLENIDPNYLTRRPDFIRYITDLASDIIKDRVWLDPDFACDILTDKVAFAKVTLIDKATLLLDKIYQTSPYVSRACCYANAVACFSLAHKLAYPVYVERLFRNRMEDINWTYRTKFNIGRQEAVAMELLGWNTSVTPTSDFLALYFAKGVAFEDDSCRCGERMDQHTFELFQSYTEAYSTLANEAFEFQKYRPSILAAAILYATRKVFGMDIIWRDELIELTGYKEFELDHVFDHFWNHLRK